MLVLHFGASKVTAKLENFMIYLESTSASDVDRAHFGLYAGFLSRVCDQNISVSSV